MSSPTPPPKKRKKLELIQTRSQNRTPCTIWISSAVFEVSVLFHCTYCFAQRNINPPAVWSVCPKAINPNNRLLTSFVTESGLAIDYSTLHLHSSCVRNGRRWWTWANGRRASGVRSWNVYGQRARAGGINGSQRCRPLSGEQSGEKKIFSLA